MTHATIPATENIYSKTNKYNQPLGHMLCLVQTAVNNILN